MNFLTIAQITFKEAIRQRLVLLASFVALALVGASRYFLRLDLGHEQLRFVFDFSSGALNFFGVIIAITSTCSLFASEMENKTVITLLSKSVNSADFAIGKICGVAMALGVFVVAIFFASMLTLFLTELSLPAEVRQARAVSYVGLLSYCFVQWLKLCMCASVAGLICSLSKSFLFSVAVSFMCVFVCVMGSALVFLDADKTWLNIVTTTLLPDFQLLDVAETFVFNGVDFQFVQLSAYAVIYIVCACALASYFFSKRDF